MIGATIIGAFLGLPSFLLTRYGFGATYELSMWVCVSMGFVAGFWWVVRT